MEMLEVLPNLGVGVGALVILFLCYKEFMAAMSKKDDAFRSYVEANNHESVKAMVSASQNISQNTEVLKECADLIKKSSEVMCDVRAIINQRDGR